MFQSAVQKCPEPGDDGGILRQVALPGAEDVEVPQRNGFQAIEGSEGAAIFLGGELADPVGGDRLALHVLVFCRELIPPASTRSP